MCTVSELDGRWHVHRSVKYTAQIGAAGLMRCLGHRTQRLQSRLASAIMITAVPMSSCDAGSHHVLAIAYLQTLPAPDLGSVRAPQAR